MSRCVESFEGMDGMAFAKSVYLTHYHHSPCAGGVNQAYAIRVMLDALAGCALQDAGFLPQGSAADESSIELDDFHSYMP